MSMVAEPLPVTSAGLILDLHHIPESHRADHRPVLVRDVDPVTEVETTVADGRRRHLDRIGDRNPARLGEVGEVLAFLVADEIVVVEMEEISRHAERATC